MGGIAVDIQILIWIQENMRSEYWDGFWAGITSMGDRGLVWILASVCLLIPKSTRQIGVCSLAALAFSFLFTNVCLKNLVQRARPFQQYAGRILPLIPAPRDFSFPSGHTSASFAAASVCFREFWSRGKRLFAAAFLILAALIGFSRLYLGVHFPTDVMAGCLVGFAAGAAGRRYADRVWKMADRG